MVILNHWPTCSAHQHWRQAVEIANNVLRHPNKVLEVYEVKLNLDHMVTRLNKILLLEPIDERLRFPLESTESDRELINHALHIQKISQLSNKNCLDPDNGYDDYLDIYVKIQNRRLKENPSVLQFVDKYFNLQLNICKSLLNDHLAARVATIKAQDQNAETFVDHLVDEVDSHHTRDSEGYLHDLLIKFLPSFYSPNVIRADLMKNEGLAERVTGFSRQCRKYVSKPLKIIGKTHKFIGNNQDVASRYYIWLRANHLCSLLERRNGKRWADAIHHRLTSLLRSGASSGANVEPSSRKRPIGTNVKSNEKSRQPHRTTFTHPPKPPSGPQSGAGSRPSLGPNRVHTNEHMRPRSTDPSRFGSDSLPNYSRFRPPSENRKQAPSNEGQQNSTPKPDSQPDSKHYSATQGETSGGVRPSSSNLVENVPPLSVFIDNEIITLEPTIDHPNPIEEVILSRPKDSTAKVADDLQEKIDTDKNLS